MLKQILAICKKRYQFVDISEILSDRTALSASGNRRPKAAFTIDDGYASILNVLDIFASFSIKPSVFICPGLIEKKTVPFQEFIRLGILLSNQKKIYLPGGRYPEPITSFKQRIESINKWVHYFKGIEPASMDNELDVLLEMVNVRLPEIMKSRYFDPLLPYSKLKQIEQQINIGAHTSHHFQLTTLDPKMAESEIKNSRNMIENIFHKECNLFAYPFGDKAAFGKREMNMAQSAGYRAAFSLLPGYLQENTTDFDLPRVNIGGGFRYFLNFKRKSMPV